MQMETDYRGRESDMRGIIEAKEEKIQRMQQEVFILREQMQQCQNQQDLNLQQSKIRTQQMADVTSFAVQMVVNFVQTSKDHLIELYDLN